MDPKYKYSIGQMVKVYDYYADMIVKDSFFGLVVDRKFYPSTGTRIYSILPDQKHSKIQTAEEFAMEPIKE